MPSSPETTSKYFFRRPNCGTRANAAAEILRFAAEHSASRVVTRPFIDPHLARTRLDRELAAALHATLFFPAPRAGRLGPLVERAVARGSRGWEVTLRAATFADGSAVTAADVVNALRKRGKVLYGY